MSAFRFAIDRGGTFTDVYAEYSDSLGQAHSIVVKLLSQDPANYQDAPTEAIRRILQQVTGDQYPKHLPVKSDKIDWIRMGTTIATNALLERKGARMALCITSGFKDVLIIGDQSRPHIFSLNIERAKPLFEEVIQVNERVRIAREGEDYLEGINGDKFHVLECLDRLTLSQQLKDIRNKGIESLAVCLVHSYAFREHELLIEEIAREVGFSNISLSGNVMPMVKLLPRASTACIDAYLTPHIKHYISEFCSGFDENISKVNILFMQSQGGLAEINSFLGSRAILSGPAGGVIGYSSISAPPLIGFDMGGTSTDVSRFAGSLETLYECEIAGVKLLAPHLDINTVAAGGGSRLFFRSGLYVVGPESAGAHPGPVCYRKNGYLAITDANLVLGRLLPEYFPKIFGPNEDLPLDYEGTFKKFEKLTEEINQFNTGNKTVFDVAMGFVRVANESMCRPIRNLTQARGYDIRTHTLVCFGGAGGQHACAIARSLGINKIVIHKHAGILSAWGLGKADVFVEEQEPYSKIITQNIQLLPERYAEITLTQQKLEASVRSKLLSQGFSDSNILIEKYLHMKFNGSDTVLMIQDQPNLDIISQFMAQYEQEHGFKIEREVRIDDIRIRGIGKIPPLYQQSISTKPPGVPVKITSTYFETQQGNKWQECPVYIWQDLASGQMISGPAIVINQTSTTVIEPDCIAELDCHANLEITVGNVAFRYSNEKDLLLLSLFSHRFMSIAEQMGKTLQRTSVSTNIKERLDFSCAIFGPDGSLVANAPHLPVHLGSMQEAVKSQINMLGTDWHEGEVVMSNHPSAGGSHLPDITVITPVFHDDRPVFYVASRGHHADIGGISPGSMPPFSKFLSEEGLAVMSFKIVQNGHFNEDVIQLFKESRCISDNISDLKAQIAANNKGIGLLTDLISEYSLSVVMAYMTFIQEAASDSVKDLLLSVSSKLGDNLSSIDYMDDGTPIALKVTIHQGKDISAFFDFSGTGYQVLSNLNCPRAVCLSAVLYCLRCMVKDEIPLNQGCLQPISVYIPDNSILNPSEDAAVVGGNVLTSQRIVDVIFKAFRACAASQGCMNNLTFGNTRFGFYETIAGGSGAGPGFNGESGVHTHMTNTRITDIEVMERRYPVLIHQFSLRPHSGGTGKYRGGDGIIREIEFLEDLEVGILSERRSLHPYGLDGGSDGAKGLNLLLRKDGKIINIGGKNAVKVSAGDRLRICTPGGGGFGTEI